MAIEKLSVILELVSGSYQREARNAATATGNIGNSAKSVTGQLGAMIGPAAIGGAIVGLGNLALKAGENADRLFDLAAQTGLSTDALQEWEFVAKTAGANTEVFSDAVKAVIRNLSETEGATGNAAKAYDTLGVAVLDASGNLRDAGSITDEVFEKLAGMENITARNALAQDIFGKKWEETISILDLGTDALGNLRDEGKKGVISPDALRNSDKFRETWQKFTATIGPKLNELLGDIAPLMIEVADAAVEIVDELQPLFDAIGFLADKYDDLKAKGLELADSDNAVEAGWGRMIGELGILNVLTGNYSGLVDAAITPSEDLAEATTEVHDSWSIAAVKAAALAGAIGPTITMLDRQTTSHRNVAKAADTQRTAMINLFDAQASLLDPVANVLRLQKDSIDAQKRLTDAQNDGDTSASDLAIATIEAEQAFLRLQSAGAALTPDQIQAFAQLLIDQFGHSEQSALDLLDTLNLLDGWQGRATFTLEGVSNAAGTSGVRGTGNINNLFDEFGFASGGIVPGPRGSQQLVLAHGGETILPTHKSPMAGRSVSINVQSPMNDFRSDLQYATILASVTNLVEGF